VFKAAKVSAFVLVAVLLLGAGYVGAQFLWHTTHHRYDTPDTGAYYGQVTASFDSLDRIGGPLFTIRFRGETAKRWRWTCPTNFAYRRLELDWSGDSSEGTATVDLPSLSYTSRGSTGVLMRALLAEWLLGRTNSTLASAEMRRVDAIFGYIEAAGRGSLPPPSHHGHSFDEPVRGHIRHFLLGYGVGGFVYIWLAVWLLLVVFSGRRFWRKYGGA
jgi:hypothetical protein